MLKIQESKLPRIIIVGGGFGGIQLAKGLPKSKFQVVVLDRHNYHSFQPLLYQVATAGLDASAIATPFRKIFDRQSEVVFRLAEAQRVDTEKKILFTSEGEITFDYLVIASGATTNFFGMKDVQENAMPMKSISQSLDIRSMLLQNFEKAVNLDHKSDEQESLIDIVIVGGGPTGVETAGALAELRKHVLPSDYPEIDFKMMDIYLVEMGPRLLAGMSEIASTKTKEFLEKMGVDVWLNTGLISYDGYKATFNNGKTILTTHLIYAAGVAGCPPDGLPSDVIARGKRISVDGNLRVKGLQNVFAIGDVSSFIPDGKQMPLPMMAPVAMQHANYLAKYFSMGLPNNHKPFVYKDQGSMATVGKHRAVVDLNFWKTQGSMAWFIWMFVHLMSIVGFGNRVLILLNWVQAYFGSDKKFRLIIQPYNKKLGKD